MSELASESMSQPPAPCDVPRWADRAKRGSALTAPRSRFLLGFLLAALIIAGGLSYLASPDPDGLDSVTLHGCTVSQTAAGEQLDGTCIAQHATESHTAKSPLADYAVGGHRGTTGLAGILGVLVTALIAGLLFRVLRRPGTPSGKG